MLQTSHGPDSKTELEAKVDRRRDGLQRAKPQHHAAVLQADVKAHVGRQRGRELFGRDRGRLPGRVGLGERGPLEEGLGFGEGVAEDAEGGGEGLWVDGGAGEGEAEEVDGLGEAGVEVVEGVDVRCVGLGDRDGLDGKGSKLEV